MAKKAYLVDFGFTVRVIADDKASDDKIEELTLEKIKRIILQDGIGQYVNLDNVGEIQVDTECPFGTFEIDKEENN